jgi:hypothetical protein
LGETVFETLTRPSDDRLVEFRRAPVIDPTPIEGQQAFIPALVRELNRIRRRGRLTELVLDQSQSAVASRLAGPFFASHLGSLEPAIADTVALGVMAGWEVDGVIKESSFGATLVFQTSDLAHWLTYALEEPFVRSTLLSPDASRVALGPVVSEGQEYLGAIVASYVLFGIGSYEVERAGLHERLRGEFMSRGVPVPRLATQIEQCSTDMSVLVRGGQVTPAEALDRILNYASKMLNTEVRGWYFELGSLDAIAFPEDLFQHDVRHVALAVNHYQPSDGAWGRYVVFLLAVGEIRMRSASIAPSPCGG